jgi:Endoplasmic Reticulum Oxidoreductin 1 (ERO1)
VSSGEQNSTAPLSGQLGPDTAENCVYERNGYDSDRDYCVPEDESSNYGYVYVSLIDNPERFTGYMGEHAQAVWREIYRENCFDMLPAKSEERELVGRSPGGTAASDLEAVMMGRSKGRVGGRTVAQENKQLRLDNTCLEKRVFWRIISGMHTSISTHLCWDYLNQTTGEWVISPHLQADNRVSTSNVSSPVSYPVPNGSKTSTSTTSSSSALSQNYPTSSRHTHTVPGTPRKTRTQNKKSGP